jgi:uncharacterized protein
MSKVQLEILGLSASQASNGAYALLFKEVGGTRRMAIVIGAPEAQAIAVEMEGIKPQRPMTHDLLKNIVEQFNSTITEVNIVDMKDNTYYATLVIDGINEDVDARPSDAIALAVRFNAPIYINESIINETGFYPENSTDINDFSDDEDDNDIMDTLKQTASDEKNEKEEDEDIDTTNLPKLEALMINLNKAIKAEDYELAAQLRDEIKKLNSYH